MSENARPLVNSIGILLDIIGAWFVAWEVVREYKGKKHDVSTGVAMGNWVVGQDVKETNEFKKWELNKYSKMRIGLALLTLGFLLQLASNWIK
jgi:hypothetical protein